jgi:quercetin dioxygenase-like cupin family protein
MKPIILFLGAALLFTGMAISQNTPSEPKLIVNPATAKWAHDKGDPPGSESVMLRQDAKTGGMELLVRFPAGHLFAPHWHESNERIFVVEGQLSLKKDSSESLVEVGGFAFLPAKEIQRLSCSSKSRCTFYLSWDGNPKTFAAK